jgi:hypothetical protein
MTARTSRTAGSHGALLPLEDYPFPVDPLNVLLSGRTTAHRRLTEGSLKSTLPAVWLIQPRQ